jgi:hypothetical protein
LEINRGDQAKKQALARIASEETVLHTGCRLTQLSLTLLNANLGHGQPIDNQQTIHGFIVFNSFTQRISIKCLK